MAKSDQLEALKSSIKSIVTSAARGDGLTTNEICRDYAELEFQELPFAQHNCSSAKEFFLTHCKDFLIENKQKWTVKVSKDSKSAHILELVKNQRDNNGGRVSRITDVARAAGFATTKVVQMERVKQKEIKIQKEKADIKKKFSDFDRMFETAKAFAKTKEPARKNIFAGPTLSQIKLTNPLKEKIQPKKEPKNCKSIMMPAVDYREKFKLDPKVSYLPESNLVDERSNSILENARKIQPTHSTKIDEKKSSL